MLKNNIHLVVKLIHFYLRTSLTNQNSILNNNDKEHALRMTIESFNTFYKTARDCANSSTSKELYRRVNKN